MPGPLQAVRQRLFLQLYAAFVGIGLLCVIAAGTTASWLWEGPGERDEAQTAATLLVETLPDDPAAAQQEFAARAARFDAAMTVWSAAGAVELQAGQTLEPPIGRSAREGWFVQGDLHGARVRLDDGRWLAAATLRPHAQTQHRRFLVILLVLAAVVAAGCYPLARGITRRLEALQDGVARWGDGDLSARAPVEGSDEVAAVAQRFNDAAQRIEQLVDTQRRMLASASHELRSPLARVRLALDLAAEEPDASARAALVVDAGADVDELDALIEDLLLAARLDQPARPVARAPVELASLLRAEGDRVDADLSLPPELTVYGDARMLKRAARNLLENARHHGGAEVSLTAWRDGDLVWVEVSDRGPGVPVSERERIFEPFHRAADHDEGRDGGVGLGLALVRRIAVAHGGEVVHRPRDGGGSTFAWSIPASDRAAGA